MCVRRSTYTLHHLRLVRLHRRCTVWPCPRPHCSALLPCLTACWAPQSRPVEDPVEDPVGGPRRGPRGPARPAKWFALPGVPGVPFRTRQKQKRAGWLAGHSRSPARAVALWRAPRFALRGRWYATSPSFALRRLMMSERPFGPPAGRGASAHQRHQRGVRGLGSQLKSH